MDALITGAPLRFRSAGEPVSGQFLARFRPPPSESRREGLARLAAWSRNAGVSAVVLEEDASALIPDLRALGFDDAGPLPRFSTPVRPGWLRRSLPALLLPRARTLTDVTVVPEALSDPEEERLRERLAPDFGALAGFPADVRSPPRAFTWCAAAGRSRAAGSNRRPRAPSRCPYWIAPPREPDLTALLAGGTLRAAGPAASVWFETPHRLLARGLFLARFLPAALAGPGARAPARGSGPSRAFHHGLAPVHRDRGAGPLTATGVQTAIIVGPTPAGAAIV